MAEIHRMMLSQVVKPLHGENDKFLAEQNLPYTPRMASDNVGDFQLSAFNDELVESSLPDS